MARRGSGSGNDLGASSGLGARTDALCASTDARSASTAPLGATQRSPQGFLHPSGSNGNGDDDGGSPCENVVGIERVHPLKARRRVVKKNKNKNKNKDKDKDTEKDKDKESEAAEVAKAPLDQASVPEGAVHGTAKHALPAAPSLVVLVVDDSRTNRVFLSRMVRTLDRRAEVLVAEDGVEGLEVLRERVRAREREREVAGGGEVDEGASVRPAVDLVLLDFSMPRMSGPEMAQAVREDMSESVRIVPIVGVTGNALPEDQAWFCECGAQEVLCKPVRRAQVEQVLGRALELARDLAS